MDNGISIQLFTLSLISCAYAALYLKVVERPVTMQEIKEKISVDLNANSVLFEAVIRNEKIEFSKGKLYFKVLMLFKW